MKFSLVVNFEKTNSLSIANDVVNFLLNKGVEVYTDQNTAQKLKNNVMVCEDLFAICEVLIVIGGDGTIIHTSKYAATYNVPVLGINSGRIGYLAAINSFDSSELENIINGNYCIEERIMLQISVESQGNVTSFIGFNDAVICKGALSRMIDIDVCVDNHPLKYRSDGLIVSTPTGSSAYSLSAGGPLLDPRLDSILLTPICPYAYIKKAMVIPPYSDVNIKIDIDKDKEAFLTVDGEVAVKISKEDIIKISRSDTTVKLIRLNSESIFDRLNNKTH